MELLLERVRCWLILRSLILSAKSLVNQHWRHRSIGDKDGEGDGEGDDFDRQCLAVCSSTELIVAGVAFKGCVSSQASGQAKPRPRDGSRNRRELLIVSPCKRCCASGSGPGADGVARFLPYFSRLFFFVFHRVFLPFFVCHGPLYIITAGS